jgi:hypothetical protein
LPGVGLFSLDGSGPTLSIHPNNWYDPVMPILVLVAVKRRWNALIFH